MAPIENLKAFILPSWEVKTVIYQREISQSTWLSSYSEDPFINRFNYYAAWMALAPLAKRAYTLISGKTLTPQPKLDTCGLALRYLFLIPAAVRVAAAVTCYISHGRDPKEKENCWYHFRRGLAESAGLISACFVSRDLSALVTAIAGLSLFAWDNHCIGVHKNYVASRYGLKKTPSKIDSSQFKWTAALWRDKLCLASRHNAQDLNTHGRNLIVQLGG